MIDYPYDSIEGDMYVDQQNILMEEWLDAENERRRYAE